MIYRVETWLRMAAIDYDSKLGSARHLIAEAPRGLIPFIHLEGETIGDSSIIINRLKELHNDPLNDGRLNESENALGALVKTLCEHELFKIMIYGRWVDGDVESFATFLLKGVSEEQLPKAIELSTKNVVSGILYRIGRYDSEFVRAALREKLDVLSYYLGDKSFLFGDKPSTIDAGLYSILASFIHFPLPNPHVQIAREYDSLVNYCDRIKAEFYSTDNWVHGA